MEVKKEMNMNRVVGTLNPSFYKKLHVLDNNGASSIW